MSRRLALVLAGGGIAGIAWETGFLLGVQDNEPDAGKALLGADLLLGTSAGATVSAQIGSATPLTELYARQLAENTTEISPHVEITDLLDLFRRAAGDGPASMPERLRAIGRRALASTTVGEDVRRAVIAARLPCHEWPERRLEITAIDVTTGERAVFDRSSGVALVDAVAASCAVPAVWPPVTIGGRRFMDGGVASSANLDAVTGCSAVVMLAPTAEPGLSPFGPSLADELSDPRFDRRLGVFADDPSIAAFGRNPLDPECRAPAAAAGREQGRRCAEAVAEFLSGA